MPEPKQLPLVFDEPRGRKKPPRHLADLAPDERKERLVELGIELPPAPVPVASYVPVTLAGGFVFVAGQVPIADGVAMLTGRLGAEVTLEQGQQAARRCALQALSALRDALGGAD